MEDLPVRPHRKTLRQTAIILNVSVKTVRRYLDDGKLDWAADQVSVTSIVQYLGNSHEDENFLEIERKIHAATSKGRRVLSGGIE